MLCGSSALKPLITINNTTHTLHTFHSNTQLAILLTHPPAPIIPGCVFQPSARPPLSHSVNNSVAQYHSNNSNNSRGLGVVGAFEQQHHTITHLHTPPLSQLRQQLL